MVQKKKKSTELPPFRTLTVRLTETLLVLLPKPNQDPWCEFTWTYKCISSCPTSTWVPPHTVADHEDDYCSLLLLPPRRVLPITDTTRKRQGSLPLLLRMLLCRMQNYCCADLFQMPSLDLTPYFALFPHINQYYSPSAITTPPIPRTLHTNLT